VGVILESSGLQAEAETPFGDLPLGIRRQVQLWAALAHEPSVLLLDEPSAGLPAEDAVELGAFIRRLPRSHGVSILIIEHDVPLLSAISDRVVAMDRGRVIAAGRAEEVLADPVVLTSYFGASEPIRGESSGET
jgi:ABC-type branched-subunit amino acid transport system ATPase component